MTSLERYLRRATRGLSGHARRSAMQELRGHIVERVLDLRAAGLSEPEALRRALHELGEPASLSVELTGVHTLPRLTRSAALLVLIVGALLVAPGVGPRPALLNLAGSPPSELGFQARPYILGTAKPIPIPTCFDLRMVPQRSAQNAFTCRPAAPKRSWLQRLLGR